MITGEDDVLASALTESQAWAEELLSQLVSTPSITGEASGVMDVLEPLLVDLSFDLERIVCDPSALAGHPEYSPATRVHPGAPHTLHGTYGGGVTTPADEVGDLLLFAHTDTEPVHHGWHHDPFRLTVDAARASGLGVADDKAGVVSILAAIRAVQLTGAQMTKRPRLVLGAGKQGGSLGTLPGTLAASGVSAAVYCHPAESRRGLTHLKVASRGILQLRVDVEGLTPEPLEERTPMSADPRLGRSAAARAARLASVVESRTDASGDRVWAVIGLSAPSVAFEMPAQASFDVVCWFADGTVASSCAEAETALRNAAQDGWEESHPPVVTVVGTRANPASCEGSPFARHVAQTLLNVSGTTVEDYVWHSASDIRFPMRCLGVPAVGLGALAGGFYGPGEWVDLASMHTCTEVLARLLTTEAAP